MILLLQLNGLRVLKGDSNMPGNRVFVEEALNWTKEKYLHRPVEIVIENIDKYGNCHGRVYFKSQNMSYDLLENGFAYVKVVGRPSNSINAFYDIEKQSRKAKVGMWGQRDKLVGFDGDLEDEEKDVDMTPFKGVLSEYISPGNFYVQRKDGSKLEIIQEEIANNHGKLKLLEEPVNVGTWCLAPFDGSLFRCRVTDKSKDGKRFTLEFVDFGNKDTFELSQLKKMPTALAKYHP